MRLNSDISLADIPAGIDSMPVRNMDQLARLDARQRAELAMLLAEVQRRAGMRQLSSMFPDAGPLARDKYPKQLQFFEAGKRYFQRVFMAANRVGKALRHGTRVATPHGWRLIEELRPGDSVIAGDGSVTTVQGVYPQGEVDLFRVSMDGVHDIVTCAQHLWQYLPPKARYPKRHSHGKWEPNPQFGQWVVGPTKDLAKLVKNGSHRQRPVIPATKPFQFPAQALPYDPYLLGVLLGDGGMSTESVILTTADPEIALAFGASASRHKDPISYGILGAISIMRGLGLQGLTSERKFIPEMYLLADAASRLAVLQGLMDTDGSIQATSGAMEFSTSSDRLADGFEGLAASLGMKTRRNRRHTKDQNGKGLPSWRIVLRSGATCPFRLARKVARWRPLKETADWLVHAVEPCGQGEATCIEVAHESHTFVIENGIVTHNTMGAGTEWAYHLTGDYPHWWQGFRFNKPIRLLVSGDTHETTRDILQLKLLGSTTDRPEKFGTGLIPGERLKSVIPRRGNVQGAVEKAYIESAHGGTSEIWFRSYEQGREIFQGVELDGFWPDEECPQDVYEEGLIRLMTTGGLCTLTFTPLQGLTDLVQNLQDSEGEEAGVAIITCGWDDVPHLDEATKSKLYAALPPHQRDARTKGIPQLGSGAIYPIDDEAIIVQDFRLPAHWKRCYGMDVGWNKTAALFGAHDIDTDTVYLYGEHYRGQAEPVIHSSAIQARGRWLRGAIDPAARGRSQVDGTQLLRAYQDLGLNLVPAVNAVESGIYEMWMRMSTGRLKVFRSCQNFLAERRVYRRDENGKIVKKKDHAMDAGRYLVMTMGQILERVPTREAAVLYEHMMRAASAHAAPLDPAMGF